MATRIQTLCEYCLDRGKEVDAQSIPVSVAEISALVDVCQDCRVEHIDPVVAMIVRFGRPESTDTPNGSRAPARHAIRATKPTTDRSAQNRIPRGAAALQAAVAKEDRLYPCPACERKFTSAVGFRDHALKIHRVHLTAVNAMVEYCRICGWDDHPTPQAIAVHLTHKHSLYNLAQMVYTLSRSEPEKVADLMAVWLAAPGPEGTEPISGLAVPFDGTEPTHDEGHDGSGELTLATA